MSPVLQSLSCSVGRRLPQPAVQQQQLPAALPCAGLQHAGKGRLLHQLRTWWLCSGVCFGRGCGKPDALAVRHGGIP